MSATGLTFRDLILRVAEDCGLALEPTTDAGVPALPSDAGELDRIKRAINDGIREMVLRNTKWKCLRRSVTITGKKDGTGAANVGGDAGRVKLPQAWSMLPLGRWMVADAAGQQATCELSIRDHHSVVAMQAANPTAKGMPFMVGFGPLDMAGEPRARGTEARLFPRPIVDVTVTGTVRVQAVELVDLADVSPFGPEHDLTVVKWGTACMKRRAPDGDRLMAVAMEALAQSIATDNELEAPAVPVMIDGNVQASGSAPYYGETVELRI